MDYKAYRLKTAPAFKLVDVATAKQALRVDGDFDDGLIQRQIDVATNLFTRLTGYCPIDQTWELSLDGWPPSETNETWWDGVRLGSRLAFQAKSLDIDKKPLKSITSIKYFDQANNATTYDASNYYADIYKNRIVINEGSQPPQPTRKTNGILIEFVAGASENAAGVPMEITEGALQLVAHLYEHRGDDPMATMAMMSQGFNHLPPGVQALWGSYRKARV